MARISGQALEIPKKGMTLSSRQQNSVYRTSLKRASTSPRSDCKVVRYTDQLKDYIKIAEQYHTKFTLVVREGKYTKIDPDLLQMADAGEIEIKRVLTRFRH